MDVLICNDIADKWNIRKGKRKKKESQKENELKKQRMRR